MLEWEEWKCHFWGGDKIGARPVNLHIEALQKLGARIEVRDHTYYAEALEGLHGAEIHLSFPSVGATENTLLAAVLASGKTIITGAAVEPEIMELIKMLQKMGAIIEMGVDRKIFIEGVKKLHGVTHEVITDRNEVVSFACLAAATNGDIFAKGARQDTLINFLNAFRRVGGEYEVKEEGIRFFRAKELIGTEIMTAPHPGFMTDWQQPFVALLTQAKGRSVMHETIYEDRFHYADDLIAMGAKIEIKTECPKGEECHYSGKGFRHVAVIEGPTNLIAVETTVRDLRSGMVNLIAALIAEGESVISGVEEIDRGYAEIDGRLRVLGAEIVREK